MLLSDRSSRVTFDGGNLLIDKQPRIVLCSSLFYFRIPRGLWRERLQSVREAGYNCIDVYTPWNHHESAPGRWDFAGERDVAAFLEMAAQEGLWVLARPGPYICSEWDGGALPAYLLAEPDLRLRDNNPAYLGHVARWFDQIMPLISRFQIDREGSVIAVQLENELDFYDCADPRGYIEALRDLALAHGLSVPLIACAGQGDISRATGDTPGVVPSCNFYPNDRAPGIEERVAPYQAMLNERGLPLIVTETNRAHFLLRRLLSSGAKLLGPYLQASGFDFGFTNGANNWGDPLAFLTSDYDFGGMIGPYGELRPEVGAARRLTRMIAALGPALAAATPTTDHGIAVATELPLVDGGPRALALAGGGLLLALPNLTEAEGAFKLRFGDDETALTIQPSSCPFVLFDFPLTGWLDGAGIAYATAELSGLQLSSEQAVLAFSGPGEVALRLPAVDGVATTAVTVQREGEQVILRFDTLTDGVATVLLAGGKSLRVLHFGNDSASRLLDVSASGEPVFAAVAPGCGPERVGSGPALNQWSALALPLAAPALNGDHLAAGPTPPHMEEAGLGRGYGWYEARLDLPATTNVSGFLLHGAADIASLYWGDSYQGAAVPGGASHYLPVAVPPTELPNKLAIRTEIWGHSNFDDARLPGLRLSAMKGIAGATAILRRHPISENWLWQQGIDAVSGQPQARAAYSAPLVAWGNGLTTRTPDRSLYSKKVQLSPDADSWVLQFAGVAALVRVWVNDQPCGTVNPRDPFVDLTAHVQPGEVARLALEVERWHGEAAGEIFLLEGRRATDWQLRGGAEQELWAAATQATAQAAVAGLPFRLPPGGVAWLFADVGSLVAPGVSWTLHPTGHNAKLTAFFNGHGVGRIWLPSAGRPLMRGGHNDALYLPAPWFTEGANLLALLVEAVEHEEAEITALAAQCRPSMI